MRHSWLPKHCLLLPAENFPWEVFFFSNLRSIFGLFSYRHSVLRPAQYVCFIGRQGSTSWNFILKCDIWMGITERIIYSWNMQCIHYSVSQLSYKKWRDMKNVVKWIINIYQNLIHIRYCYILQLPHKNKILLNYLLGNILKSFLIRAQINIYF